MSRSGEGDAIVHRIASTARTVTEKRRSWENLSDLTLRHNSQRVLDFKSFDRGDIRRKYQP